MNFLTERLVKTQDGRYEDSRGRQLQQRKIVTYIHEVADQVLVDDVFMPEWRLGKLLEVDWQVLKIPAVLLDLAQLDPLDRIGLQHAHD